jgi:hypothetical protein
MDGQTQIPEALMGAMLIEQGSQKGQFQPVTRDGQPTVAARLMQQATPQPMGVGQAMEQAGLAAQIQAMQAQQAQQALMQQAMAQRQPQMLAGGGLANLNVDIDGFADGGIVGYAEGAYVKNPLALLFEKIKEVGLPTRGGLSADRETQPERVDSELAREILAATTPMQENPENRDQESAPAPREQGESRPTGIAAVSPAAEYYDRARAELSQLTTQPVSPESGIAGAAAARRAKDEVRRSMGLPPIAEELARQEAEFKGLSEERQALIARRLREAEDKRSTGQLGAFLRSARGRSLGDTLGAAERGREAFESGLTGQIRGFEDLQIQIKGLQIEKQNALNKMRDEIAMGDYQGAMQSGEKAREAQNALQRLYADVSTKQAKDVSDEFRTRMTTQESAARTALMAQQGVDAKVQGALTANLRNKEAIEKNITSDFEKDQRVKAYRAIQMTGKIPPEIQAGYDRAVSERDRLINSRTRNINATIDRLETQLYGAPVGGAASAGAITMDDVRTTAAKSGKTVQQVIEQAKAKGYSITGQ